MTQYRFLTSSELIQHRTSLKRVIEHEHRLPERLFSAGVMQYFFFEFDLIMSPEFWTVVRDVSVGMSTREVFFAVLDPDPISYYEKEFGYCSAFVLPVSSDPDDYYGALAAEPPNSPADAIMYNSNVVVCAPDNYRWAMWGERDAGIGILGSLTLLPESSAIARYSISLQHATELGIQSLRLKDSVAARFRECVTREFSVNEDRC